MMAAESTRHGLALGELLSGFVESTELEDVPVFGVAMDSRDVVEGDLFLACAGSGRHGLDFLDTVVEAGAAAIVWEPDARWNIERVASARRETVVPLIALPSLSRHAGAIAACFFGRPSRDLAVVAVTGTNGKSSVCAFIGQALQGRCAVMGTLGYGVPGQQDPASHTTPDPVRLQGLLARYRDAGLTHVAMEASSHGLEQHRLGGTEPWVAVFTNLTRDHLDYHGDMQAYAQAKARLFSLPGLEKAVINADDAFGRTLITQLEGKLDVIAYSMDPAQVNRSDNCLVADALDLTAGGMVLTVAWQGQSAGLQVPLLGAFNAANLLAALAALLGLGVEFREAVGLLQTVRSPAGRMERFGGSTGATLVVDYAHTPDALEQALTALRAHCDGQLWCVFGCGGDRDAGKRPMMGRVAEAAADRVLITDDNPRYEDPDRIIADILQGASDPERMIVLRDREQAITRAYSEAGPGDIVLVAGKGHENWQLVAGERLEHDDRVVAAGLTRPLGTVQ